MFLARRRDAEERSGRDRHFTGKSFWTYPIVEFTTRDGRLVRQTFQQAARPRVGRKLRIVYDPAALPDGRSRSASIGLTLGRTRQ